VRYLSDSTVGADVDRHVLPDLPPAEDVAREQLVEVLVRVHEESTRLFTRLTDPCVA
jgi:hypothetical protein